MENIKKQILEKDLAEYLNQTGQKIENLFPEVLQEMIEIIFEKKDYKKCARVCR